MFTRTHLPMVWAHTVRPYGMPTENEFTCVIFIWFRCLECCVAVYTVRRGRRTYGITCTDRIATVRRGRTPGHLLLPFGQFTLSHPTVIFNRFRCCWIWTRNAHPTMSYAAAGKRCRFDLKKLFQKILKKGLTKRGFCYILNKSSAMSHQKRQQLNKMESWLSGRRRTIGNRVGVMSVSRVQIPNSPP